MTRVDEFSRLLGNIEEAIKGLTRSIDLDRKLANERHQENTGALQILDNRMDALESTVSPLKETVDRMEPIVKGVEVKGWMKAGAVGVLLAIGWVLLTVAEKLGGWAWGLIKH